MRLLAVQMMNPSDESARADWLAEIYHAISMIWAGLELAEQQQDQQHHQNQSAEPHSRVAHAIAIAAKSAAEAAEQDDDQDDNEDQAERHVNSPWARRSTYDDRRPRTQQSTLRG